MTDTNEPAMPSPGMGTDDSLSTNILTALKSAGTPRRLRRGEVLMREGSPAESFFIVLNGRFIVEHGDRPIAEIATGEPIGEIAFFAGGQRSASVVAARGSEVLEITRESYHKVARAVPDLPEAIIAALAERVRRTVPGTAGLKPRPGEVIGILPAAGGTLDPAFLKSFVRAVNAEADAVHLTRADLTPGQSLADRIAGGDGRGRFILLDCADPDADPDWAQDVAQMVDTVIFVLDTRRDGADLTGPSPLETQIGGSSLVQNIHLAVLRADSDAPIRGTAALLEHRKVGLHHHLRAGSAPDMAQLARFATGRALGAVFGGGGAFGTGHLGLLKALTAHGIAIDMVGGTSVGAAMAGAFAMGLSPDEVLDRCDDIFVRSRAMKRLTVPKYSIIDHTHFDRNLRRHYGETLIEDLPIPFYAISTSLTRSDLSVHRSGSLWRAVRASGSIPAVFPPMVFADGEVCVDGALLDNVPVRTMRGLKAGPNLVLSMEGKKDWRVKTDYDALPGRLASLRRVLAGPLARRIRFPGIFSIMMRSMVVNSEQRLAQVDPGEDIFVPVRPLPGMAFLDWTKGRRLFEDSHDRAHAALESASQGASGLEMLRLAAARLADPPSAEG